MCEVNFDKRGEKVIAFFFLNLHKFCSQRENWNENRCKGKLNNVWFERICELNMKHKFKGNVSENLKLIYKLLIITIHNDTSIKIKITILIKKSI